MDKPMEYIDRTALIDGIKTIYCAECDSYNKVCCRACLISDALDCIADAPAADVAPVVHGEWLEKFHIIPMYDDKQMRGSFKTCSICGFILVGESNMPMNYCPNCGAKLDGGTHEKV